MIWKILLGAVAAFVAFFVYRLLSLASASRTMAPPPGLSANGKFPACESPMRCVSSDDAGEANVEPLEIAGTPEEVRGRLRAAIEKTGGKVRVEKASYVHATFQTPLMGFVDDVEFRVEGNRVAVKSASRVGKSDLGANRKRVEALRAAL